MEVLGINTDNNATILVSLFTSTEALLLPYEQALTRTDTLTGLPRLFGAWLDRERTRQLDHAHVGYMQAL